MGVTSRKRAAQKNIIKLLDNFKKRVCEKESERRKKNIKNCLTILKKESCEKRLTFFEAGREKRKKKIKIYKKFKGVAQVVENEGNKILKKI
jgi:hypothetical protein